MASISALGRPMRSHFQFSESYTPLNHGSFGTYPKAVHEVLTKFREQAEAQPDTFIRYTYPAKLDESRKAVASLVHAPADEIVFLSNATTAANTVLRGIKWDEGDVIVYFPVVYGAIERTVEYITETTNAESEVINVAWPADDAEVLQKYEETINKINREGKDKRRVRMAIFDTIVSMPGFRLPFEQLVAASRKLGVLSLIDGAHGVGHIPLDLGKLDADFFCSNLHKWLYLPRGCAILHVPVRNQHLVRSSLPTSHGFIPSPVPGKPVPTNPFPPSNRSPFIEMFDFIGTIDCTNYLCVPAALSFRQEVCGGEAAIMNYCMQVAYEGGHRAADILGTEVLDNKARTMTKCALVNVRLPLATGRGEGEIREEDAGFLTQWIAKTSAETFDTFLVTAYYRGDWWWRISGQVYISVEDIIWGAKVMKELCERAKRGDYRAVKAKL